MSPPLRSVASDRLSFGGSVQSMYDLGLISEAERDGLIKKTGEKAVSAGGRDIGSLPQADAPPDSSPVPIAISSDVMLSIVGDDIKAEFEAYTLEQTTPSSETWPASGDRMR